MLKSIAVFVFSILSICSLAQKDRYIIFVDAETGDSIEGVTLTAINSSRPIVNYQDGVLALKKHKKKYNYYISSDNYESRSLSGSEVPAKKDTALVFILPTQSLMDERWDAFTSDSTLGISDETIFLKNSRELEAYVVNRVVISRAAMIQCETLHARGSSFYFRMAFEVAEDGALYNPTVDYSGELECVYLLREMKRILWEMPNIQIEDAISGLNGSRQRLILPITIGI